MKDFILDMWYSVLHCLIYSLRGITRASVILLVTILVSSMMPKEIAFLSQPISLELYHSALYAIGVMYALQILITTWIKDYRREYLPRWLLS